MATITVEFTFETDGDKHTVSEEFDVCDSLDSEFDTFVDDTIDDLTENDEDWTCTSQEVIYWDDDFKAPSEFDRIDDYGEYVELCETYGEPFTQRYDDINGLTGRDFEDTYVGCFDSVEEYAQNYADGIGDIPGWLECHIDWDSLGRSLLMDCSEYWCGGDLHIFRDH